MAIQREPYVDVRQRLTELGCSPPSGVALIPTNLDTALAPTDFVFPLSTLTVQKILAQAELAIENILPPDVPVLHRFDHDGDWMLPTILVTADWLTRHPDGLEAIIGIILDYAERIYRVLQSPRTTMSVVREYSDGSYTRVSYRGPVEGLSDLPSIVRSVSPLDQGNVDR